MLLEGLKLRNEFLEYFWKEKDYAFKNFYNNYEKACKNNEEYSIIMLGLLLEDPFVKTLVHYLDDDKKIYDIFNKLLDNEENRYDWLHKFLVNYEFRIDENNFFVLNLRLGDKIESLGEGESLSFDEWGFIYDSISFESIIDWGCKIIG